MAPWLIKYLIFLTEHIATAETDGALGQQINGADKKGKLTSFRWGLRSKRISLRDQNYLILTFKMNQSKPHKWVKDMKTLFWTFNWTFTQMKSCFNLSFHLKSPHGDGPLETEPVTRLPKDYCLHDPCCLPCVWSRWCKPHKCSISGVNWSQGWREAFSSEGRLHKISMVCYRAVMAPDHQRLSGLLTNPWILPWSI